MLASETQRAHTLSTLEFDVLTDHFGLGTMPLVLDVPSPGKTHTERRELASSAWQSLSARGFGGPTRLNPEVERMLRVLASPAHEVDGRMWFGRSVRVLAASATDSEGEWGSEAEGASAVLAVKDGDEITLRWVSTTGLAREAAGVLPELPPGTGRSVTVRSAQLDAATGEAGDDPHILETELRILGVRTDDAGALARMVAEARYYGQFGAASGDLWHRRRRADHVVGFFDSPHGRYVQLRRTSPSGDAWSTFGPIDVWRLIGYINEVLDEARSAHG